jgi:Uma2 family endonuclease
MATARSQEGITFEDFCAIVDGDQKADLIDGVIYMASPDNTDANELFVWLVSLLHDYVQAKELGRVYGSRVAFRLNETNAPEPDIAFMSNQRLGAVRRGNIEGPPDLAIEIVSPESVERDYEKKRRQYEKAGVREYWIVDEMEGKVTLLGLAKGKFREARARKGVLASKVLPGFRLRPAWLWQRPLPNKVEILQEILAGQV